jgi:hypothetical protein
MKSFTDSVAVPSMQLTAKTLEYQVHLKSDAAAAFTVGL